MGRAVNWLKAAGTKQLRETTSKERSKENTAGETKTNYRTGKQLNVSRGKNGKGKYRRCVEGTRQQRRL